MADTDDIAGTNWSDSEQDLVVADYIDILQIELGGGTVNKAERKRALQALTGRSGGSIEFKRANISAALTWIGLPIIRGYLPRYNIQDSLIDAVDRYLSARPGLLGAEPPALSGSGAPGLAEAPAVFMEPAPVRSGAEPAPRKRAQALIRKFDPAERDHRNRVLGKDGEAFIVAFEQRRLHDGGRKDLAGQVRWVADEEGDGHGYDIASFALSGETRLIEVKTTTGGQTTPFFLTRNEERVSREVEAFRLYRLYDFRKTPRLFKLRPPLGESVVLETETWRAGFG